MDKPIISYPIIVEGKYDKIKLDSLFIADVFVTSGFGIFRRSDKVDFFRKLAETRPLIILTDSDGAGLVIRNRFRSMLPPDKQIHLYTPEIRGRERRKKTASKYGKLGVEGIDSAILREILRPYTVEAVREKMRAEGLGDDVEAPLPLLSRGRPLLKSDLYAFGLSGRGKSAEKRRKLAAELGFATDISAQSFISAVNLLYSKQEFIEILKKNGMYDPENDPDIVPSTSMRKR